MLKVVQRPPATAAIPGALGATVFTLGAATAAGKADPLIKAAHALQARLPMPAVNVRAMKDQDLKAIYRYIKHLGAGGTEAPAYLPPDKTPNPPFVQFPAPPK